ncbi:MFS transporter [Desulfotruncus alcoholivorax]|uniref:MFS transporter n=1 Tax=Desulfotruncus alcoholivorax TaxID=265477 RepID=UPI0009D69EA9
MYSPTVLIPFYYQRVLGFSAQKSGLYMMASPIAMAVISPFSGALSDKIGSTALTTTGLIIKKIALVLLTNATLQTPVSLIVIYLALMGLSLGLFQCLCASPPENLFFLPKTVKETLSR